MCVFSCCQILMAKIVCSQLVHSVTLCLRKLTDTTQIDVDCRNTMSWTDLTKTLKTANDDVLRSKICTVADRAISFIFSNTGGSTKSFYRECCLQDFRSNLCKLNSVRKIPFHSAKISLATLNPGFDACKKLLAQLGGSKVDKAISVRSRQMYQVFRNISRRGDAHRWINVQVG